MLVTIGVLVALWVSENFQLDFSFLTVFSH